MHNSYFKMLLSGKAFALLLLLLFLISSSLWAQGFSSLEERMTFKEFRQAGLEKLSAVELAALNDWIRQHSLGGEEPAFANTTGGSNQRQVYPEGVDPERLGFSDYKGDDVPITARIVGTFTGWNGDTEFELDNGMVWQQTEQGLLGVRPRENPEVTIQPGFLSSWELRIEGVNKRIKVKRIK